MSVHHLCAWHLQRPELVIRYPGTGVTELRVTMWVQGINPGPVEEWSVLLTTEAALQS